MSEIKGQLLGIILTLMVFGGVAATVAKIYADSASKVTNYADNIEGDAADGTLRRAIFLLGVVQPKSPTASSAVQVALLLLEMTGTIVGHQVVGAAVIVQRVSGVGSATVLDVEISDVVVIAAIGTFHGLIK